MASPFFPPCGFLYRLCPRHRMCIESYKKESGAPAFSSCQIYRRFPALFSYFPLPAFRPAKSAFELFHNALPGQCNRKSGHYIEERRKMRPCRRLFHQEPTACRLFPNVSGGASHAHDISLFGAADEKTAGEGRRQAVNGRTVPRIMAAFMGPVQSMTRGVI